MKIYSFFDFLWLQIQRILLWGIFFTIFGLIAKALQPLSPIITFLVVLFFTGLTLENKIATILSLSGLLLYVLSWPIAFRINKELGIFCSYAGIILWFLSLAFISDLFKKSVNSQNNKT